MFDPAIEVDDGQRAFYVRVAMMTAAGVCAGVAFLLGFFVR
ncbi:MAG TPA: hypothetical protein VFR41_05835 [Acidimicrobiia bacterium]|nr:hypothetical protein [Acidimicrobiia bacterium]